MVTLDTTLWSLEKSPGLRVMRVVFERLDTEIITETYWRAVRWDR